MIKAFAYLENETGEKAFLGDEVSFCQDGQWWTGVICYIDAPYYETERGFFLLEGYSRTFWMDKSTHFEISVKKKEK